MDGDVITVDRMLREGMAVDVTNEDGRTALHWATLCNQTDVIKRLLHEGADVNRHNRYEYTSLHFAAQHNKTEAV